MNHVNRLEAIIAECPDCRRRHNIERPLVEYPQFAHQPIPLWTRVRLWFKRGNYSYDEGPEGKAWVYAKELNGVVYILDSGLEPPTALSEIYCKCSKPVQDRISNYCKNCDKIIWQN